MRRHGGDSRVICLPMKRCKVGSQTAMCDAIDRSLQPGNERRLGDQSGAAVDALLQWEGDRGRLIGRDQGAQSLDLQGGRVEGRGEGRLPTGEGVQFPGQRASPAAASDGRWGRRRAKIRVTKACSREHA